MSLEDKVKDNKENRSFIRKAGRLAWKLGMAAATTALSLSTVGTLGVAVGAGLGTGKMIANLARGKSFYDSIGNGLTSYSAVNTIISPIVWLGNYTFPLIQNATLGGKIMRGIYASTLYNAAFIGTYNAASHLVDNYLNPKGIWGTIKKDFFRDCLSIGALFSIPYYLIANNITQLAMYHPSIGYNIAPTFAVGAPPVAFTHNYLFPNGKQSHKH